MNMKNKTWIGFLVNLLGVILGIMLTFGVSSLYQKRDEKNRMKEMLILVRNELETDKMWFENQEKIMRQDIYVYKKILEAKSDWTSIPKDTLRAYYLRTMSLEFNQLTTSAWQIFQNAEIVQKMRDKELIIRLTDCYFWIEKIQEIIVTEYWNEKRLRIAPEVDMYKYFDALMSDKNTVFFYTNMTSETFDAWNLFPMIEAIIDYTINLLDDHGDYRYDMAEKDNEIEAFIQSRMDSVSRQK